MWLGMEGRLRTLDTIAAKSAALVHGARLREVLPLSRGGGQAGGGMAPLDQGLERRNQPGGQVQGCGVGSGFEQGQVGLGKQV